MDYQKRASDKNTESTFEQLEERVLFDGVPDATFVQPEAEAPQATPEPAQLQAAEPADISAGRQLVIVDPAADNSEALLNAIIGDAEGRQTQVHTLDPTVDGVGQISDLLAGSDGRYDAVHIIADGEDGQLQLGRTLLNDATVGRYANQLAQWSTSLVEGAELNFHGAELESYAAGEALLESIAVVTGADVSDETMSDNLQIIFVDAGVNDADALIDDARRGFDDNATYEIYDLDGNSDGLSQIAEVLDGRVGINAIHIISHGDEGEVRLGNAVITSDNLQQYQSQLASWASALTQDADVLFYGCELAGNAEGEAFIESISAITGADVAASDDLTGAEELGGDWVLEKIIGTVDTVTLTATAFSGVLNATPYSFGEMLATGGVTLPLGITAEAEFFSVGTGAAAIGPNHGDTGLNPASLGGNLNDGDVGFDEANRTLGPVEATTRIHSVNAAAISDGANSNYANGIGFHITFSSPIPADYFYALDLDGDEWKTAWGYDVNGDFVQPTISTETGSTQLSVRSGVTIDEAGWEADNPGLDVPAQLDLVARTGSGGRVGPDDTANQAIFDFGGEPLTELYFVFGRENLSTNTTGGSNSGLSALFLSIPNLEVTKTPTAATLQTDGTYDVTYEVLVENTGAAAFESFSLTDDLIDISNLGTAFNGLKSGVVVTPVVSTGGSDFPIANSSFDGDGDTELLDQTDTVLFQAGDSFTATFTVNVDTSGAALTVGNSASAAGQPVGFAGSLLIEASDGDGDDSNGNNPTLLDLEEPADKDGDGVFDLFDLDDDNDGILDTEEIAIDTDGDGVPDHCDLDSDNDGISDLYESGTSAANIAADTNGDGTISLAESAAATGGLGDADGDGLMDIFDADIADASGAASLGTVPVDSDNDGFEDYVDLDSDNDGIADTIEARPTAGYVANDGDVTDSDADGDGVIDIFDSNDTTTGEFGGTHANFNAPEDTNSDGTPDYLEFDSDGDGASDTSESGLTLSGDDLDGDGIDDAVNASYADPDGDVNDPINDLENATDNDPSDADYRSVNDKDGDGVADFEDLDDDNDGILDTDELGEFVPATFTVDSVGTAGNETGSFAFDNGLTGTWDIASSGFDAIEASGPSVAGGQFYIYDGGVNWVLESTFSFTSSTPGDVRLALYGNTEPDASFTGNKGFNSRFSDYTISWTGGDPAAQALIVDPAAQIVQGDGTLLSNGDGFTQDGIIGNSTLQWSIVFPEGATGFTIQATGGAFLEGFRFAAVSNVLDTDGDGVPDHCDLDSDNDGISDLYESGTSAANIAADTNGDGTISLAESAAATGGLGDADGDGLMDIFDADIADASGAASLGTDPVDSDLDGVDDYLDLDSDNDGIADTIEARPTAGYVANDGDVTDNDADGDGVIDIFDSNDTTTGEFGGTHANFNAPEDTDNDGTPDYLDIDSDGDLINDVHESGLPATTDATYVDPDGSVNTTLADLENGTDNDPSDVDFRSVNDKDGDGVADFEDLDDDNDGILDSEEGYQGISAILNSTSGTLPDGTTYTVTITNGTVNILGNGDFDINAGDVGNSITTITFSRPTTAVLSNTTSSHGRIWEDSPLADSPARATTDGSDWVREFGTVGADSIVLNGQSAEADPGDNWVTTNADWGSLTTTSATTITFRAVFNEGISITALLPIDSDGDGLPDHCDLDSDNDGISDLYESGTSAANIAADTNGDGTISLAESAAITGNSGDADGDGLMDIFDANTTDPSGAASVGTVPQNSDTDSTPDYLDLDSDNDGIADTIEARPTAGYVANDAATDVDGVTNNDADGDGVIDIFDSNDGTTGEFGGTHANFNAPEDTDNDGTPDYLDSDSDGDGKLDSVESGLGATTDATYQDPDGGIATTSPDLDNEYGDTSEVGFRELAPEIGVAKEVVGIPSPQADGTFAITYQVVFENTGTADLTSLSAIEDLATQFGPAFVSATNLSVTTAPTDTDSNIVVDAAWDGDGATQLLDSTGGANVLVVGDSFTVQFDVVVNPTSSALDNQVTASGAALGPDGTPVTDGSGDPVVATDTSDSGSDPDGDNLGEDGDTGGSDDATPLYLPSIGLAKQAGDAVANGDYFDVEFTLAWENTGNVALDSVEILDDIATQFGAQFIGVSAVTIQNFAGTGSAPTANAAWNNSSTTASLVTSTGAIAAGDSFEVVFTVTIDPDVSGTSSAGLANQATSSGEALDPNGDPILDASGDPVTADDVSDNGTDPTGENGEDNGDGTFANDPTPIVIADIAVAKEVFSTAPVGDNFEVTYRLVVENTGNVDLGDVSLVDDIAMQFGGAFVSAGSLQMIVPPGDTGSNIVLDTTGWDGDGTSGVSEMVNQLANNVLKVGDFFVVQITVVVDPDASGTSGSLNNQATAGGDAIDENGDPITNSSGAPIVITDDSDNGTDPNTDNGEGTTDDATPLLIADLAVAKQANAVVNATDGSGNEINGVFDVQYLVVIENTGTIELTNLQLSDDMTDLAHFGDAYNPTFIGTGTTDRSGMIVGPAFVSNTMANPSDLPTLDAGFLAGGGMTGIFDGISGALQVGEQIVVSFTVRIDGLELLDNEPLTDGVGGNQITGAADSAEGTATDESDNGLNPNTDNSGGGTDDFTPFEVPQVRLWKSHSDAVDNGDGTSTITVSLRVENSGTVDLTNLTLSEDLATQFGAAFVSATDPTISGPNDAASNIPSTLINGGWNLDTTQDVFDTGMTTESLAAGDEFTVTFDVVVDPDLLDDDSDYLENNAVVTGDGQNFDGTTITVTDDSGFDDGSGVDVDEPTSAIVPEIAVAKVAGDAVANGENWDVTFTLVVENTGSINLADLTLLDDIDAQFGNAFVGVTGLAIQNFAGSGTAPTVDAAWLGDTTTSLLTGGSLDPGDRFEVVYTVTIDPDGIDSIAQGLSNQASVGGNAVDDMGNPLTDESGDSLTATDDSDSGSNPQGTNDGENGDTGSDADPTPIVIADVAAAKQVVGTPTILSNGNFEVTYQVVIENTGTVDLANLSLLEDLATQFGGAYVDAHSLTMATPPSATSNVALDTTNWNGGTTAEMVNTTVPSLLAVGDSFILHFTVEIDAAMATGVLDNTVTVGGAAVDANGDPLTDSSGNPITAADDSDSGSDPSDDNSGEPGDDGTGGTDDATPLYIPSIGLAKESGDAVANGDNFDVEFTLVWENTGTVALDNVELLDDVAAQFGGQFIGATLDSINFTGAGVAPTLNAGWVADTTQSLVTSGGAIQVGDSFEVVFTVTIDPDVSGTSSAGLSNQATSSGEALDENGDPLVDSSGDPITASDNSDNGTDPIGENSDDNGDGIFGNDPTPIVIADIAVAKSVVGTPTALANGNFSVVYELVIENNGNVDLAGVTLVEDLATQFGTALVSAGSITRSSGPTDAASSITLDGTWDGDGTTEMVSQTATTLLAVGDSFVIQFTVEVDPDAVGAPGQLDNQVTAGGDAVDSSGQPITDSSGNPIVVTDESDSGSDPNGENATDPGDNGTSDDATPLMIPSIGLAKSAGDAVANGDDFDITFTFVYENTGTVDLTTLTMMDDIMAEFGNAFVEVIPASLAISGTPALLPGINAAWEADTSLDMLDGTGRLNAGESFEVSFTVTIDPDGIDSVSRGLENQGTAGGVGINPVTDAVDPTLVATDDSDNGTDPNGENGEDNGDGTFGNDPTQIVIADVSAAKQVVGTPTLLSNGNFEATYQVVIENTGTVDLAGLTLDEDLATQFGGAYVNAYGLTLTTPPADADSNIALDTTNWNGGTDTEMVNIVLPSLLAVGDSFILQFTVEIDAAAATGVLDNTVTVGGAAVDENGDPIEDSTGSPITTTDDSDSGSDPSNDNAGEPGDDGTGGTDDATPLYIPNIGLAKEAGDAVASGDNFDVTFTLNWENTGTVDLTSVQILDDIAAQFGSQYLAATIDTVTYGGAATVTANTGWETDSSQSLINTTGTIAVGETIQVVFTVTVDPDVTGTSSTGLSNQATSSGEALDENGLPLTDGSANPITATDTSDNGTDPTGENGSEDTTDGTFGNDPTPIVIADIAAAKEVSGTPVLQPDGTFVLTFEVVVENTGNVDLAGISLIEDLSSQFGTALVSAGNLTLVSGPADPNSAVTVDTDWNGNLDTEMVSQSANTLLAVGDSFTVQFTAVVDPDAVGAPGALTNQVTTGGTAVDENGQPILDSNGDEIQPTDESDSGDNPNSDNPGEPGDNGTTADPTQIYVPSLGVAKQAGDAVANGDNWDITFTFVVENTGTVDLNNLTLVDDVEDQFGNAFVEVVAGSLTVAGSPTILPGANAAWEADTSLNMLDATGLLNIGESIEVSFIVTIDPDGVDSLSQGIENHGTAGGDALDENGNPITDGNGDPVQASDDSDNGTDPNTDNGEDANGDGVVGNDPTPIVIADMGVAKQATGTAVQLSNGNFEVVYQLIVENNGTVDLASLSLVDDLATQFGPAFVDVSNLTLLTAPTDAASTVALDTGWDGTATSDIIDQSAITALAVGDSFVVNFTVEINAALGTGDLSNTATAGATAVDENGDPITDSNGDPIEATDDSDSGTDPSADNPNAPGDDSAGGTNDPTPLQIPDIGLAKSASDAVANGENFDVTFTLVWQNTGTVALHNVQLMDDIAAQLGDQYVEILAGSLSVTNIVGSTTPTANTAWETDTTKSLIAGNGALEVGDSFSVTFTVTIDPDAAGTSAGLGNLASSTGDAVDANGNPVTDSNGDPVTASDDSDNGTDPVGENDDEDTTDGTFGNDPTPIVIADIAAAKQVVGTPTLISNGNYETTYQVVIENTGTVDLASLTLGEDLATQFGPAYVNAHSLTITTPPSADSTITLDAASWNGASATELIDTTVDSLLVVGDSFVLEFTVEIDAAQATAVLENTITATGTAVGEGGLPLTGASGGEISASDDSDSGSNPNSDNAGEPGDDGVGATDNPTPLYIPSVGVAKQAGFAVPNGENMDVTFTLMWQNTGTTVLNNLGLVDDLETEFGDQIVSVTGLTVANYSGTGTAPTANTAWETDTTENMLVGGIANQGDSFEVTFTVTLQPNETGSFNGLENQATGSGDALDENGQPLVDSFGAVQSASDSSDDGSDPTAENESDNTDGVAGNDATPILYGDLEIAKGITDISAIDGDGIATVTFQVTVENAGTAALENLSLLEDLAGQLDPAFVDAGNLALIVSPTDSASSITLNTTNWNGDSDIELVDTTASSHLAAGDSFTIEFTVQVTAADLEEDAANQVIGSGTAVDAAGDEILDIAGDPIVIGDVSDSGLDTGSENDEASDDGIFGNDPTPLSIPIPENSAGVTGNPPSLPGFGAFAGSPLGNLLTNYSNSAGTIYSGRGIVGGYSGSGTGTGGGATGSFGNVANNQALSDSFVANSNCGCQPAGSALTSNLAWSLQPQSTTDDASRQFAITLNGNALSGQTASVELNLNGRDLNGRSTIDKQIIQRVLDAIDQYQGPGRLSFDGQRLTWSADQWGNEMAPLLIDVPVAGEDADELLKNMSLLLDEAMNSTIQDNGQGEVDNLPAPIPEDSLPVYEDGNQPTSRIDDAANGTEFKVSFLTRFANWLSKPTDV